MEVWNSSSNFKIQVLYNLTSKAARKEGFPILVQCWSRRSNYYVSRALHVLPLNSHISI
jgi:hypothetical protein